MAFGVNLAILGALLIWIRCCQRVSIIYIREVHSIHPGSSLIANLGNDCSAYLESMRGQFRELVKEIQILKLLLVLHYIS
jgi:hypothetical protein